MEIMDNIKIMSSRSLALEETDSLETQHDEKLIHMSDSSHCSKHAEYSLTFADDSEGNVAIDPRKVIPENTETQGADVISTCPDPDPDEEDHDQLSVDTEELPFFACKTSPRPTSPFPESPTGSENLEQDKLQNCLVCLESSSSFQLGLGFDQNENIFMTLNKYLDIRDSSVVSIWDFTKELVPICDTCFSFAQKIVELEIQADIIKSEMERKLYLIKKTITDSEQKRSDPLTDKRYIKWRTMALKSAEKILEPQPNQKRGRGRPRKTEQQLVRKRVAIKIRRTTRKVCSVKLDPFETFGNSIEPEVTFNSDADDFHEESQNLPVPTKVRKTGTRAKKKEVRSEVSASSPPKRKRAIRSPVKLAECISDEDEWAPDNNKDSSEEEEINQTSSESEVISDSEIEETVYGKKSQRRRREKSSTSKGDGFKWITDKRRKTLHYGKIEVFYLQSEEKGFGLECSECHHKVEGTKIKDYAKNNMRKHIIRHHLGIYRCSHLECGKVYSGRKELKNHELSAHQNIRQFCEICGKPFSFETSLKRHLWSHKNAVEKAEYLASGKKKIGRSEDPCQCTICGRAFMSSVYLKRHERVHTDVKSRLTHMCTMCGKLFVSASGLNYHVSSVHEKDKIDTTDWILCPDCPRKFKKRHQLKKHMPVHTGETCCTCAICGRSFKSLSALRFHKHVHDDARANPCKYCDKAFKRRHHLQRHCEIFHPGGKTLPQRPQNRLKGPGGTDGGPAAAGSSVHKIKRKNLTGLIGISNNFQVSVITNSGGQEETGRLSQTPLDLANTCRLPRQELNSQQQNQAHQQGFTQPPMAYEYPYDFQSLMKF